MFKKILIVLLCLSLSFVFTLCACKDNQSKDDTIEFEETPIVPDDEFKNENEDTTTNDEEKGDQEWTPIYP